MTKPKVDGTILYVAEPEPDALQRLTKALVDLGARETKCSVCGCWLLTREADDLCPPCREVAN